MKHARKALAVGCSLPLLAAGIMLASCNTSPVSPLREGDAIVFPSVWGKNLLGDRVNFPDDIKGTPTLVLVAFYQPQQTEVNTWLDRIPDLEAAIPDLRVIETPTIKGAQWGLMAPYIDGAMRSGIPDPEARARTITLYTHTRRFREALGLGPDDRIYALLLDRGARLIHTEEGPLDAEKFARTIEAARALPAAPGSHP
jgi:hypothetical protein